MTSPEFMGRKKIVPLRNLKIPAPFLAQSQFLKNNNTAEKFERQVSQQCSLTQY